MQAVCESKLICLTVSHAAEKKTDVDKHPHPYNCSYCFNPKPPM